LGDGKYSLLGCIGTEDRCTAVFSELHALNRLENLSLVEIVDVESEYSPRSAEKCANNRAIYANGGAADEDIHLINLLENEEGIFRWIESFAQRSDRIILDISSLPKRFFFPAIKILLRNPAVLDLIVTYTLPIRYHDGNLAERPSDWRALPSFGPQDYPEPKYQMAIVGVGFLPFGLPDLLKSGFKEAKPHLFFPFPASPSTYAKTWEFVRQIESSLLLTGKDQLVQINTLDPSDTYNHIMWLTDSGTKSVLFAPYGPKPMSLGMAIYASMRGSPVFYTQPRVYHPDYSIGVKVEGGTPAVFAYCLKLDGRNLYD
jgi:hypothetical protein